MMIIPARYNGPPGTGHGGYTSGLVAEELAAVRPDPATPAGSGAPTESDPSVSLAATGAHMFPPDLANTGEPGVEVTLRVPPPLDTELTVEPDGTGIAVRHAATLVATARPGIVDELVPAVSHDVAEEASDRYPGFTSHPFPTCYTCGPERSDGLRLFPGRLTDGHTATPFVVPDDVTPATVWAALDCPGGWAVDIEARPYVLGRITAQVAAVPAPGSRCVVTGMLLGRDGRKAYVATTVWGPDGRPLGTAKATWIALPGGQ